MFNTGLLYQNAGQSAHFDWWRGGSAKTGVRNQLQVFLSIPLHNLILYYIIAFPSYIWHPIQPRIGWICANNSIDCAIKFYPGHSPIREHEHG